VEIGKQLLMTRGALTCVYRKPYPY
jgi:high-affinity K+ transport system ATPase subunit B